MGLLQRTSHSTRCHCKGACTFAVGASARSMRSGVTRRPFPPSPQSRTASRSTRIPSTGSWSKNRREARNAQLPACAELCIIAGFLGAMPQDSVSMVAVAQLVESRIVIPVVAGSSPVGHPIKTPFPRKLSPASNRIFRYSYRRHRSGMSNLSITVRSMVSASSEPRVSIHSRKSTYTPPSRFKAHDMPTAQDCPEGGGVDDFTCPN
jgi:hypothetical protein